MAHMLERLEKIREEIEELEEDELNWNNLEKLSILYNVEHHMCKRLGMEVEEGLYSNSEMGFKEIGERGSRGMNSRELREMTNSMGRRELADVLVGYGRDLSMRGDSDGYMKLYSRLRNYSNGNGGNGSGNGNGR